MRNVAMLIAYDGTDFVGSQWQNDGRTVQGALEGAWQQLTQERRRFTLAGRTDAGVHAQGQVANVRTDTRHPLTTLLRGMNAILPEDVTIQAVREVDLEFHARYSAVQREYRYLIDTAPAPLPNLRNFVLHAPGQLNVEAIAEALHSLEGTHDFAAFAAAVPDQRSSVRRMYRAQPVMIECFGRSLLAIELAANAFLQHMVRVIVGTTLLVGRGRMTVERFREVLTAADRKAAGPTAAAHGLTLVNVQYPSSVLQWQ